MKNIFWQVFVLGIFSTFFSSKITAQDQITITFDTLAPVCSINSTACTAIVTYPFQVLANDDQTLTLSHQVRLPDSTLVDDAFGVLTGNYPNYEISGDYPIGDYQFEVEVSDEGGSDSTFVLPFEVVDCHLSEVTCLSFMIIDLYPTEPGTDADGDGDEDQGASAAWAIDFFYPLEDCSLPFKYSINRLGETPNIDQTGIVVTCDDPETLIIETYFWDAAFNPYSMQPDGTIGGPNYKKCEVTLFLNDWLSVCGSGPIDRSVNGTVTTPTSNPIEGVEVLVEGSLYSDTLYTNSNGVFTSGTPVPPATYTLTLAYEDNPFYGVTTQDMILIKKHILSISKLDNPYSLLAADVNSSGHISTRDLIDLQQLIIGTEPILPNGVNWRFIPGGYVFPNTGNPWEEPIPEVTYYDIFNLNALDGNFIGIKIGDVNHSALTD